ncbi:hypothetical protein [Kosakonia cowanii]|uniref:hypothetical protein n=1 Tax=Kosakonia cowanii TaxID=208223 RepID=UPI004063BB05
MIWNILSVIGLFISAASAYYAYKAFSSTKEISFPKVKPRENVCLVKQFSKEAKDLEQFIKEHKHRRVYLSIDLDGNNFEASRDVDSASLSVWTEEFDHIKEGEKPSSFNSHGFQITVANVDHGYGDFSWFKGNYRLSGYFFIEDYRGPYQGIMAAVISPAKNI